MRSLALHALMLIFMGIGIGHANDMSQPIAAEFRVVVNRADSLSRVRVINRTVPEVRLLGMNLYFSRASAPPANRQWVNIYGISGPIRIHTLNKGEHIERMPPRAPFIMDLWRNEYAIWKWEGELQDPPPGVTVPEPPVIHLGYVPAEGGDLRPPYVDTDSGTVSNLLAFVFHQNTKGGFPLDNAPPNELAFLTLNGTEEPLQVVPPLSAESILHVSAPGIGYSAEITLQDSGFEAQVIPPGESGQWRIPFERILEQIPAETVEAIRAADGVLDVMWRAGDLESPPLPLILLPPTQAERDAAFLAEHADVPRIDEHTDLSLDLRLAGIEGDPVLLGRLRNNEPHAVVADDQFVSQIRLKYYLAELGNYGLLFPGRSLSGNYFAIDPTDRTSFHVSFPAMLNPIEFIITRLHGEDADLGYLVAYEWLPMELRSDRIWVAFPDKNNAIHKLPSLRDHPDTIAPLLAYVHNPGTSPELTCVLWNRTEEEIDVANTRIVVTAPAIDYRRELSLPTGLDLPATVAPGEHTDWRIAWQAIRDMIPADDLARIEAAGGELDLVWQVNGLDSPPLPLLLGWDGQAE